MADMTNATDVTSDWYWEGNVVEALARHLERDGWSIVRKADTHSKERGVDLHVRRSGTDLLIEAKGYPSTSYRDPRRVGESKRTNPTNQAQHWYSHALLKAMRLQTEFPEAKIAIGFPDFPRYRTLFDETQTGLARLGVAMFTVTESGGVRSWGLD
jgi:hypothetical protein